MGKYMQRIRSRKKHDTNMAELIWYGYVSVKVPLKQASTTLISNFYKKGSGECDIVVETKRSSFGN